MAKFQYNDIRELPKRKHQPEQTKYYKYPESQRKASFEYTDNVINVFVNAIQHGGQKGVELLCELHRPLTEIRPGEPGWKRRQIYISETYPSGIWHHTPWSVIEELYNHIRTDKDPNNPQKGKKDLTVNMVEKWNRLYGSDPELSIEMVPSLKANPATNFNKLFTTEESK